MVMILGVLAMLLCVSVVTGAAEKPVRVRMGVLPYFDYSGWSIPVAMGWDKELGLDIELMYFASEARASEALLSRSIDVSAGSILTLIPLYAKAPDLRVWMNAVQYKGNMLEVRSGEFKTYRDFLQELGDQKEAVRRAVEQLKGKTILLSRSINEPFLASVLEQGGLTLKDVIMMDMDQKDGAAAFIRGVGDAYRGGLPQHKKLRAMGGYEPLVENEQCGPAGLWFSSAMTLDDYLNNNYEVVLKLLALHFRSARMIRENPETALPIMGDYLRKAAAADLTYEDLLETSGKDVLYATIGEAKELFYDSESLAFWERAFDYYLDMRIELGQVKEGEVDKEEMCVFLSMLADLENNEELMEFVNAPF